MDWRDLRIALAVGQHGTLARSGRSVGLDPTTVSRRISALERNLGVSLFVRERRRWRPTEAGRTLLARCENMAAEVRALAHDADRAAGRVGGKVRLTTVDAVMATWIVPNLERLVGAWPELQVEMLVTNEMLDLTRGRADVAIRLKRPARAGLMVKRLGRIEMVVAGRPRVADRPRDARPVVLLGLMDTDNAENRAVQRNGGPVVGSTTSFATLVSLVREGVGLGLLPRLLAEAEGFTVLDDDVRPASLWRAVPEELADAPRVRAVTDWLDVIFAEGPR